MNKISKKIVALATMAAFVLTLVPAAAFGATADVDPGNSSIQTVEEDAQVNAGVPVQYQLNLKQATASVPAQNAQVYVWVTDNDNNNAVVRNVTFFTDEDGETPAQSENLVWLNNGRVLKTNNSGDERVMALSIAEAGNYTIHAGVDLDVATGSEASTTVNSLSELTTLNNVVNHSVIEVTVGEIDGLTVEFNNVVSPNVEDKADYEVNENNEIYANNTASQTVTVKATSGNLAAAGKDFTISTNNKNITVTPGDTATTDENGEFDLTYRVAKAGTYYVTLTSEDGYKVRLVVYATSNEEAYPAAISGNSEDVILNVDEIAQNDTLEDAVQFTIKDQNGNAYAEDLATVEPAAGATTVDELPVSKSDYVTLVGKPDGFKGEATDFTLAWVPEEKVYTLSYDGEVADLAAGKYTVRVALYATGDYADVTFTLGEFDEDAIVDMQLIPSTDRVAYNAGSFTYDVILVDENGVQSNITEDTTYNIGVDSNRLVFANVDTRGTVDFAAIPTVDGLEQIIGSQITLTVVSQTYGFIKTADVTITDVDVVEGLAFDSENGPANENNIVNISVVNEDGDVVNVDGEVTAFVASSSNENANVDVQVTDNGTEVTEGKGGQLSIFADEETTLEIVVAVVNDENQKVYADTLTYTVGAEDVNADKLVAMTIGSSDYIVDNDVVAGDAAPYIDSAWRTMVPIRALAETFGATVDFDNDARTITIVDGDTTVVMTIGEDTYTVNDEEQTMDTAPVIGEGDRAFVPVRFVAEALGYTVTPLQDANGLTASVVFQK